MASFDGELVRWQTGFRSGSIRLGEIENIRRRFGAVVEIASANGRITLAPLDGYRDFLAAILRERPDAAWPKEPVLRPRRRRMETLRCED